MVLYVKDKNLKKEVYKRIRKNENSALKEYNKGNLKQGKKYEDMADKIYKKYYKRIWGEK